MNLKLPKIPNWGQIEALFFYQIPLVTKFREITVREGIIIKGSAGYGEFCPFNDYTDVQAIPWLTAALEAAFNPVVDSPKRKNIPVNAIIPIVSPAATKTIVAQSKCTTVKVKVAGDKCDFETDVKRLRAVRETLGPKGNIRIDVNGKWTVTEAQQKINLLAEAAQGLQYVEQPVKTITEMQKLKQKINIPIAADESIRISIKPDLTAIKNSADLAIIKSTPLGGVRKALEISDAVGLPVIISSALESSIGLYSQLKTAALLPELNYACGLNTLSLLKGDLVSDQTALTGKAGYINLPDTPPVPDENKLIKYAMKSPERLNYWYQRLNRVITLLK